MPGRMDFDLSVYLVTDHALCGQRGVIETVRQAIAAGATMVQLRDPTAKTRALVEEARALVALLRPAGIPFIVDDRVDVAIAAQADGVHLGQSDMAVADARALMGPGPLLGLSITAMADLAVSDLEGVDYLGVGPVFHTATKADAAPAMGLAGLAAVRAASSLPIVAIGGIGSGEHGRDDRGGGRWRRRGFGDLRRAGCRGSYAAPRRNRGGGETALGLEPVPGAEDPGDDAQADGEEHEGHGKADEDVDVGQPIERPAEAADQIDHRVEQRHRLPQRAAAS